MKLKNATTKAVLAENYEICNKPISKALGLMFHKKIKKKALIFVFSAEKLVPLHMLFVFFPIDILYIGKDKKVVEIKESLNPFSFYTPKKKAQYIIELPQGIVKKTKTRIGDKIEF